MLKKLTQLFFITGIFLLPFTVNVSAHASSADALAADALDGGTINLRAITGKAFAAKLPDYTHMIGLYTKVAGPEWLSISEDGILFGSPTKGMEGQVEVYFSVRNGQEENFRVVLTLESEPIAAKYQWTVRVGEVFKIDLAKLEGPTKGGYGYFSLPAWLNADPTGLLYGVPGKENAGENRFQVTVDGKSFEVSVTVRPLEEITPGPGSHYSVGSRITIDVFRSINEPGTYRVSGPSWLHFYSNGILDGVAPVHAVGRHILTVNVQRLFSSRNYYLTIVIDP
jgi:hypothetical protein